MGAEGNYSFLIVPSALIQYETEALLLCTAVAIDQSNCNSAAAVGASGSPTLATSGMPMLTFKWSGHMTEMLSGRILIFDKN
jgi:hypothetical protein